MNGWIPQHEEIIKSWKNKSFINMWLQSHSSYYYSKINNIISYTVIVISSVSSAALFSSAEYKIGDLNLINYLVGSLNIISAILISINRQLKPAELYQSHASIGKKYHNLIRNIDACLSLTTDLRPNAIVFLEKIGREIDILENNQIDPPRFIAKKFEKNYGSIEGLMYGDDVLELMKLDHKNKKELKRFKTANISHFLSTSPKTPDIKIINNEIAMDNEERLSDYSKFEYLLKKKPSIIKRSSIQEDYARSENPTNP